MNKINLFKKIFYFMVRLVVPKIILIVDDSKNPGKKTQLSLFSNSVIGVVWTKKEYYAFCIRF
jgi:hypothetical protein